MTNTNRINTNHLESLEIEQSLEAVASVRDTEAEERFSAEFAAFLSPETPVRLDTETPKESSGTIYFTSIEERVVKFNQVEPTIVEQQSEDKPKIVIPNPVVNVMSEKNLKQATDAGKLVSKSIIDLFKDYIFFSTKKEKKKDPAQLEKEAKQNANKRSFFDSLRQLGGKNKLYEVRLKESAEHVSRKLGGNLSYEGTIQESMEVRIDIESLMDKKNSELNASELSAKRARAVQAASGGKSKPGHRVAKQEMNPEKGLNAGQRNAYTQAG